MAPTEFEATLTKQEGVAPPSEADISTKTTQGLSPEKAVSLKELTKPEHGGAGMSAVYQISPHVLSIEEGFNPRDIATQQRKAYIDWLAENIAQNGVQRPLVVRQDGAKTIIVDGECRWRASLLAIEKHGADLKTVPVQLEPKGTDEAMRLARVVNIYNNSNPLTPLEQASAVAKLIGMGWSHEQVAKNFAISKPRVFQLLDTMALPADVKKHVKDGKITATLATEIVKKQGEKEGAKAINAAVKEQEKTAKEGKKAAKVKPGQVRKPAEAGKSKAAAAPNPNSIGVIRERIQVAFGKWNCGKVHKDPGAEIKVVEGQVAVIFPKKDFDVLRKTMNALGMPDGK